MPTLTQPHWSFIVVLPMIIATALLLWRKGALGLKAVLAAAAACLAIAWFVVATL